MIGEWMTGASALLMATAALIDALRRLRARDGREDSAGAASDPADG